MNKDGSRVGFNPGSGRSPGGGHGNPPQYSCLENPLDGGAWWAAAHRVTKCRTQVKQLAHTHTRSLIWSSVLYLALNRITFGHPLFLLWLAKSWLHGEYQFSLVAQSCPALCEPMDCSAPGSPVLHYLLEFAQIHVH